VEVQTFECSETASETIEAAEEAIQLIQDLGLEGQLELVSPKDQKTRCPYREMTAEERFVYGVLCPVKSPMERYNRTPIPLRVLQIASHAKGLGICDHLEVWDAASPAEKDPVLVGLCGPNYSPTKTFIFARWGEELETFSTLVSRAVEVKRKAIVGKLREIAASIPGEIAKAESRSDAEILKLGAAELPAFYAK
jgi:hypothetical protein